MTDDLGEQWLLIRSSRADTIDLTDFLSNAPADTVRDVRVQVAGGRYYIEHLLEEVKDTAGLGQYELRYWQS